MNIETKFKIGDFVRHKFQRSPLGKSQTCLGAVVQYIHTETCSAGTQVFYNLRFLIQAMKHDSQLWAAKDNELVDILPGADPTNHKFREDELVALPEDIVKIITQEV